MSGLPRLGILLQTGVISHAPQVQLSGRISAARVLMAKVDTGTSLGVMRGAMSGFCLVWFGVSSLFYSVYEGACGSSILWLSKLLERVMGGELLIEIGPSYDGCQMSAGKMAVEKYHNFESTRLGVCFLEWDMSQHVQDTYYTTNSGLFRDDATTSILTEHQVS